MSCREHESISRRLPSQDVRHHCIPLQEASHWKTALEGIPHAFGHTWENCYAMHLSTGYKTFLYTFETNGVRIVCPLAERPFQGHMDIVTPYGLSGFVGNGPCSLFPRYWKQFARRQGYLCGYIAMHPLLHEASYLDAAETYAFNRIYALDLSLDLGELFARLSSNRRRQLRASRENTTFLFDRKRLLNFLLRHCLDFFRQKGASSAYHFAPQTLTELANRENVLLIGAEGADGLEAVTLFAFTPYVGEYVLNVYIGDGQQHTVALLWKGLQMLKEKQVPWLNLGGGIRPEDGVAEFKKRFGGETFSLRSLKQVYNRRAFQRLCLQMQVDSHDFAGYFPPYRGT